MWLFLGMPALALLAMLAIHASFSINDARAHWSEYRCHPAYIPIAGMIRPDVSTSDNFLHCIDRMGTDVFKLALDPVNAMFGDIHASVGEMMTPLKLFRAMFGRMRKFMLSFTATTFGKITESTSVFVHYLIKIRDVLQRFVGEGYIAALLVNTGINFVMSFVYLCMSVIKTFVYALLAISIILALFQPEMLAVAITIASMIAASGY
jgi:hypothetical protein